MTSFVSSIDPDHSNLADEPADRVCSAPEPLWRHMVGDRLRTLRKGRGETLSETAERAGVSPQYLSEMERGTKEPSSEMIAAVAGALDVTLLDLTVAVAEALRSAHAQSHETTNRAAFRLAA